MFSSCYWNFLSTDDTMSRQASSGHQVNDENSFVNLVWSMSERLIVELTNSTIKQWWGSQGWGLRHESPKVKQETTSPTRYFIKLVLLFLRRRKVISSRVGERKINQRESSCNLAVTFPWRSLLLLRQVSCVVHHRLYSLKADFVLQRLQFKEF